VNADFSKQKKVVLHVLKSSDPAKNYSLSYLHIAEKNNRCENGIGENVNKEMDDI